MLCWAEDLFFSLYYFAKKNNGVHGFGMSKKEVSQL